ncbi:MAG: hypothetical protein A4S12_07580 [Proteobacteria bacterium SG_bin5]|nr:MAG: hypothetical protein A4S12_07580 [Proteobacteria bacterium SG_bin5]
MNRLDELASALTIIAAHADENGGGRDVSNAIHGIAGAIVDQAQAIDDLLQRHRRASTEA